MVFEEMEEEPEPEPVTTATAAAAAPSATPAGRKKVQIEEDSVGRCRLPPSIPC